MKRRGMERSLSNQPARQIERIERRLFLMFVTNLYPGGYWEDRGYNWFGGS